MPNWYDNMLTAVGRPGDIEKFTAYATAGVWDEHGPVFRLGNIHPTPKGVDVLGWQQENWGTKGDIESWACRRRALSAKLSAVAWRFGSAWSPPWEALSTAADQHPDVAFYLAWSDPNTGAAGLREFSGPLRRDIGPTVLPSARTPVAFVQTSTMSWLRLDPGQADSGRGFAGLVGPASLGRSVRAALLRSVPSTPDLPFALIEARGYPVPDLGRDVVATPWPNRLGATAQLTGRAHVRSVVEGDLVAGWVGDGYEIKPDLLRSIAEHAPALAAVNPSGALGALLGAAYPENDVAGPTAAILDGNDPAAVTGIAAALIAQRPPATVDDLATATLGIAAPVR